MRRLVLAAAMTLLFQLSLATLDSQRLARRAPQKDAAARGETHARAIEAHYSEKRCFSVCRAIWDSGLLNLPETIPECQQRLCKNKPALGTKLYNTPYLFELGIETVRASHMIQDKCVKDGVSCLMTGH